MTSERFTRRRFLQGSAVAGVAALLGACDATTSAPPGSASANPGPTPARPAPTPGDLRPTGPLTFANWDGYIDLADDGITSPTIVAFEGEYGVEVNDANAEIEDNEAFVATIRPQLERGVEPGWDLVILSDWMAARLVARDWLERIDPAHVPNAVRNLRADQKGPPWDPTHQFHYPWVSFATGIAWNRAAVGRDLSTIEELFDLSLAGRVTLLQAARETLPMIHLLLQARGATSARRTDEMTLDDALAAIAFLEPYVASGHVRGFTRTEHVGDLIEGRSAAALASSGDLAPIVGDTEGFAYPDEGWLAWSEALLIPRAAKHRYTAELLIDWVYDPDRAARVTNGVYGISPVNGVARTLVNLDNAPDPERPPWTLLFPPDGVLARRHRRPTWPEELEAEIEDQFAELTGPAS